MLGNVSLSLWGIVFGDFDVGDIEVYKIEYFDI